MAKQKEKLVGDGTATMAEVDLDRMLDTGTGVKIVQPVSDISMDYAAKLAFMEEPVTIVVHGAADPNAENPVPVGNCGRVIYIPRDTKVTIKRKFLDCLITKSGIVSTPEYTNGAGERARAIRVHSAHKYPLSIIRDDNPKGAEWLERRMAEV